MILIQHELETMRELGSAMLTSSGYECREAISPKEVWDILNSEIAPLTICVPCSEDLHGFCIDGPDDRRSAETCGCAGSKNCKDRSDRANRKAVELLICKVMETLEEGLIERVVERFPNIPVVVWGCRPLPPFLEAMSKGAYDYLPVPFEREQLLAVVRRALDHRRTKLNSLDASCWQVRWP